MAEYNLGEGRADCGPAGGLAGCVPAGEGGAAVERIVQTAPIFPLGQPQAASICLKRRARGDRELGVRRQISSEGKPGETMAVLGYLPALLHSS